MSLNVLGGGLEFDATIDDSQFSASMNRMQRQINALSANANQKSNDIENFAKKAAIAATSFLSVQAAGNFVQSMVQVRGEFQKIEIAYRTILKSKAAGDKLLAESVELAAKTPFALSDVASGAKQLLAYGFGAQTITDNLTTLGNVAAGVGAPLNDIVYLYGTLKTQGRAYQRDIMQFTSRGIPIVAELAKVFGVTEKQVQGLVESGKVGFPEVEKAFNNLTSSSGIFFNLMEEQSKSLTGQLSNLSDAWDVMLNNLGKSQEGILSDGIGAITSLVENYQKVLDIIGLLILAYGAYRVALLVTAINTRLLQEAQLQAALSGNVLAASQLRGAGAMAILRQATFSLRAGLIALSSTVALSTAGLTLVIGVVYALASANDSLEQSEREINDIRTQSNKKVSEEKIKIDELVKATKDNTLSKEEQAKALQKIIALNPTMLAGLNAQNIATKEGQKIIGDYIKSLSDRAEGELAYAQKQKNIQKIIGLKSNGLDELSTGEKIGQRMQAFFTGKFLNAADDDKKIIDQNIKDLEDANKKIDKLYGDKIRKSIVGDIPKSTGTPEVKRNINFLDEKIKDAQNRQKTATAKEYASIQKEINKLEAEKTAITGKLNKTETKQSDDRLAALQKINDAEREFSNSTLSNNEKEIKSAKDKYNELRKVAKEAGLGAGAFARIDNLEKKETGSIQYNQGTEKLKTELDQQKQIFADFEAYKKEVGETFAKERYEKELEIAKATQDKAAKELAGLLTIQAVGGGLTNNQQERLNLLIQSLKAESDLKQEQQDKDLADALNATKTFEQKKKEIEAEFDRLKLALPADANYIEASKELERQKNEKIDAAKDEVIEKQKIFAEYYKGVEDLSDANAKRLVADTRKILEEIYKGGKISKDLYEKISKDLVSTSKAIDERLPKKLGELASSLGGIANQVKNIDGGFGDMLGTLANVVGSVGNIKSSIDALKQAQGNGDLLGGLTAGLGIAGGVMSLIGGVFDEDNKRKAEQKRLEREQIDYANNLQLKAIDAQTKAMERQLALIKDIYGAERLEKYGNALVELQKKQTQAALASSFKFENTGNKQEDEVIARLNRGESIKSIGDSALSKGAGGAIKVDKALLGAVASVYDKINKGNLKMLTIDLSKPLEEIERLQQLLDNGKLDETTAANVQSLITYTKQYQETLNAFKAETTGSTFEEIGNDIVDMFSRGEASAEDFGKSFQNIMRKYLLNTFKGQVMDKALQDYYNKFDEYAKDGLNENEKNSLQSLYAQILEDNQKKFEQLQEVTGIDLTEKDISGSKNTLSGQIKGITADQADLLAGQFGGLRLTQLLTNDILNFQLTVQKNQLSVQGAIALSLVNIEAYTLRTANNTDRLFKIETDISTIATKIESAANALRAGGKI